MSYWQSSKARRVYAALGRIGWTLKKQVGSHRRFTRRDGGPSRLRFTMATKSVRAALAKIAKETGLKPEDL